MLPYTYFPSLEASANTIAERFLHTVVVLDDEATYGSSPEVPRGIELKEPTFDNMPVEPVKVSPEYLSHSLNAKRLTESFADKGLICSVLVPRNEESLRDEISKSSKRADIVILDWNIHHRKGDLTKQMIADIVRNDTSDLHRLRLIIIYTAEPDVIEIGNDVAQSLGQSPENQTVITVGATRICVISKQETKEEVLPSVIIGTFANMIAGLLPLVAVAGVTALRENTYRLLGRFDGSLDPGYLAHRVLSPNPAETEQHLEMALSSELRALVEDSRVGSVAGIEAIRGWLEYMKDNLPNLSSSLKPLSNRDKNNPIALAGDLLEDGIAEHSNRIGGRDKDRLHSFATAFASESNHSNTVNQQFAGLLSLKHSYDLPRRLWLGAVLAGTDNDEPPSYWLCVQPRCDSVNLKVTTSFAFLRLLSISEKTSGSHPCVIQDGVTFHTLIVSKRAGHLSCFDFEPSATGDILAQGQDGEFRVYANGQSFRWVCELKEEFAQRAVNAFSAWNSRVGASESEWLRRQL